MISKGFPRVAKRSPRITKWGPMITKGSPKVAKRGSRTALGDPRIAKRCAGNTKQGQRIANGCGGVNTCWDVPDSPSSVSLEVLGMSGCDFPCARGSDQPSNRQGYAQSDALGIGRGIGWAQP